jgi:hypothetical protein
VPAFPLGEQLVQALGSRTAGEGDGAKGLVLQACIKDATDFERGSKEEIPGSRENF